MTYPQALIGLEASTIAKLVRRREVSPVEVISATLQAIDELNPKLHAFCTLVPEQAMRVAADLETRIMRGEDPGPLAGVPVGIKDLVLTRHIRTTFGSALYKDFVPEVDDVAVERLRAAGAVIIGKTNAAEFGYGGVGHNPIFPTTRNPWDTSRTSGGSSAGSAAAVAAGICPLALGSDGGGSIRLPAALTGIVGVKPSMGRIPLWPGCRDETLPGVSGWESIEHYGPLARTVTDAALFLDVTTGPDSRDRLSLPDDGLSWLAATTEPIRKALRIAWIPQWEGLPIEADVLATAECAAVRLTEAIGASMELAKAPFADLIDAFRNLVLLETDITGMRALAKGRENQLSTSVQKLLSANPVSSSYSDAIVARKRAFNSMARFMGAYDLILTPTVPVTAFSIDLDGPGHINGVSVEDDAWTPCLFPANLTGQPAISVPAGFAKNGLPVGLQIIGRRLDDYTTMQVAAACERAFPWIKSVPGTSVWRQN